MQRRWRVLTLAAVGAICLCVGAAALGPRLATGASLDTLRAQLSAQQRRQQTLQASISHLRALAGSLEGQIALVQRREAAVAQQLAAQRLALARTGRALKQVRARLALLRLRLARARTLLANQLRSGYEDPHPDLVEVVLQADGFSQLLDQLNFLGDAERQQQQLIAITRAARDREQAMAAVLARLQDRERLAALAAAQRVRALAGMNALLSSRESALARTRAAQQAALSASRAQGQSLESDIARVQAQEQAAAQAATSSPASPSPGSSGGSGSSNAPSAGGGSAPGAATTPATPTPTGPALGPSGGWAIPYPIVLCESGGQNLTPNSAGASGYYQILPSTWQEYGGTGPAAYLASKAEQDTVAARIWDGGRGAAAWVCAQKLGYVH